MLLTGYTKEIFRAECNPSFESLHCIARLNEDVGAALPYLNAVLGGFSYITDPPSVTFKVHGRLITVHADRIAINALRDEDQAEKILAWLQREINQAWANRDAIAPCYQGTPRPQVMDILKRLPRRAGCRQCGRPSCLAFAAQAAEGVVGAENCPVLDGDALAALKDYLSGFRFDD